MDLDASLKQYAPIIIIIIVHVEKEMSSEYSSQKLCIILAEPYFELYFFLWDDFNHIITMLHILLLLRMILSRKYTCCTFKNTVWKFIEMLAFPHHQN